jgi:hypothetical protein
MAQATPIRPYWILGVLAWGDLANFTYYRSHTGIVTVIPKTWPIKPPSPDQSTQRARFSAAIAAWWALTPAKRQQWMTAATRASLCLHGYNLFLHWQMMQDSDAIRTLQRQTQTDLIP